MKSFLPLFIAMILFACTYENEENLNKTEDLSITLRWLPSHSNETLEEAMTGFKWGLSFLGAELPLNSFERSVTFVDQTLFTINLSVLIWEEHAHAALRQLVNQLKASEEYELAGGIDLGRFIMLSLNSSRHYYAITGAFPTLKDFLKAQQFSATKAAIVESSVSKGQRIISLPQGKTVGQLAFLALEGSGSIQDKTFLTKEYEVMDVMSNGQMRFAIYDIDGNLITAADSNYSAGGKPAKCLWCHETFAQLTYKATTSLDPYLSPIEFNNFISTINDGLDDYRKDLSTDLDFDSQAEHEYLEILYLSFMQPSAERLAVEWNMSSGDLELLLTGLKTHTVEEFPFLSPSYSREEVDKLAPYKSVKVPSSSREFSAYEPNFIF